MAISNFEIIKRIRAFEASRALPKTSTICTFQGLEKDTLFIAFLRMGGVSSPWAIAWCQPNGKINCVSTPNPRIASLVREPVVKFAHVLLEHLGHPATKGASQLRAEIDGSKSERIRQVWVANNTHLDMLHQIAYRYERTKEGSEGEKNILLSLSRASNFLFQENQRPGQVAVVTSTSALKESFVVPADNIRQGHLGFLTAWIDESIPSIQRATQAAHAEEQSVSTTLNPKIEKSLAPLLEQFGEAYDGAKQNTARANEIASSIHKVLEAECVRRLELVKKAWHILISDKRESNPGLGKLVSASNKELDYYLSTESKFMAGETPYVAAPETDHWAAGAASRYLGHSYGEALKFKSLVPNDNALLVECLASGNALVGKVINVRNDGVGRRTVPVWTIECEDFGVLKLREGSSVFLSSNSKITPEVTRVEQIVLKNGNPGFRFELTHTEQVRIAKERTWIGETVVLLKDHGEGFIERKRMMIFDKSGPGSWLTHGKKSGT